jgi:hypothetical protein
MEIKNVNRPTSALVIHVLNDSKSDLNILQSAFNKENCLLMSLMKTGQPTFEDPQFLQNKSAGNVVFEPKNNEDHELFNYSQKVVNEVHSLFTGKRRKLA